MALQLPQKLDLAGRRARAQALEKTRADYQFAFSDGAPPSIAEVPAREKVGAEHLLTLFADMEKVSLELRLDHMFEIFHIFRKESPLKKFDEMYPVRGLPAVNSRWRSDEEFGRQRLDGLNPTLICRCTALPAHFPVTDALVGGLLRPGATLASEMEAGRVYLCDYKLLDGLPSPAERHLTAPMILLYVDDLNRLLPIAIQLGQSPAAGPIFTPKDPPMLWLAVKTHCQVSEVAVHEVAAHLLRTHLVSETIYISAMRQLSADHPLNELLRPHFWFTLSINAGARKYLIADGGPVPKCFALGYAGTCELLARAWKTWTFGRFAVPADLKRRGVDDKKVLPGYYYRDDAHAMWNVLEEYARALVANFYPTVEDLAGDYELQGWLRELTSPEWCGLPGLPVTDGGMRSQDQLVSFLTQILFTVSAEHAAVNNGQFDYFGYVPNMPATFLLPPPTRKDELKEEDIAAALPVFRLASEQITMVHLLSQPTDQPLGTYSKDFMSGRPDALPIVEAFRANLAALSDKIRERNRSLSVPYTYLDPRQIAQSIAV
ncbi:MAG: hypothetical protein HYZ53_23665 [Planctomycetes bacterium]|nr:hypothetical protein [Planctomycetota bacterium]